jgi:sterol desaturase/sphingolipid hydroxylase (fatty acid hydroxylase superfamily)
MRVEDLKSRNYHGFGPLSLQPMWLEIVEIYVLFDFFEYWSHRLFHRGRWWPFHAVHHSSEDLDWLSSVRVHPVNEFVSKLCQVTPFLLLGFNPLITLSVPTFLTFYAIFIHANVDWDFGPLRYVIATPVFHRWHHSKDREAWNKNFAGLFPFWDILFGTFYMPKGRVPVDFGIPEKFPKDFVGQLTHPFARAFRRKERAEINIQHPTSDAQQPMAQAR